MSDIYKRLLARNDEFDENMGEGETPDEVAALSPAERRARYKKLLAEANEKFQAEYGFPHDCSCAIDYALSNVEIVPNCFLEMVDEAMKRIAIYHKYDPVLKEVAGASWLAMQEELAAVSGDA